MDRIPQCLLVKDRPGSSFWKLELVVTIPSRCCTCQEGSCWIMSVRFDTDRIPTSSGFSFTGASLLPNWWRARRASVGYVEHERVCLLALGLCHKHHFCQNFTPSEPSVDYAAVRMLQKINKCLEDLGRIDVFWGMLSVTTIQQIHRTHHRVCKWCLSRYNTTSIAQPW